MKLIIQKTLLLTTIVLLSSSYAISQRTISGTVYMDGEPAAGITVKIHRGTEAFTGFDGKYEVTGDERSNWISFTYLDDTKRVDFEDVNIENNVFDYAFTGELPSGENNEDSGVILKSRDELIQEQDRNYMELSSLYESEITNNNYRRALPNWEKVYNRYPKSSKNIYIHGARMYNDFIKNAPTDEEKEEYLQKLMGIYDKRIEYFGEEGSVLGRKAVDWLDANINSRNNPIEGEKLKEVYTKAYNWLSKSVEEQGNESQAAILVLFMQTSRQLFKLGEISKETVVSNYDKIIKIMDAVIKENADQARVAEMTQYKPNVEGIFGESGAADCDALASIYEPQFREKGNDLEFLKDMLTLLDKANCNGSELYSQASEKLYELEPSARAAYSLARSFISKGDMEKGKSYFQDAMEQETDNDLLASYYLQYGNVLYSEGAYQDARTYAKKVLAIDPANCRANMLIGNIYVASSRTFEGEAFQKAAIFWLAVDYFNKARRGEDCSIEAAEKANQYSVYFPNSEDGFMLSVHEGDNYHIGGWINEDTTARY